MVRDISAQLEAADALVVHVVWMTAHHDVWHLLQKSSGCLVHLANLALIPAQSLRLEPVHELNQLLLVETGL